MNESVPRPARQAVHVVDDDAQMRRAIWFMLDAAGYSPRVFADGDDLLAELDYLPVAPLLLDMCMPGFGTLDLLVETKRRIPAAPVIIITGHADIFSAVQAMKAGATDFIVKPFPMDVLLTAVDAAAVDLSATLYQADWLSDARRRVAMLSAREREVLDGLVAGKSNKVIAYDLDLSTRTVEMHRVRMMRRLSVRTLAEALRIAHLATAATAQHRPFSVTARKRGRAA